jgi:hypothetical protein
LSKARNSTEQDFLLAWFSESRVACGLSTKSEAFPGMPVLPPINIGATRSKVRCALSAGYAIDAGSDRRTADSPLVV